MKLTSFSGQATIGSVKCINGTNQSSKFLNPNHSSTIRRSSSNLKIQASRVAEPIELDVVSVTGESIGIEKLSLKVADEDKAKGLVHRYVVKVRRDMRQGNACTKTRAEVRGGGRKPYPQKGRGMARRGSNRSPLIRGGGVIFGPKPKDWSVKMNKKERRIAMATALQSAAEDILLCENLKEKITDGKTKTLISTLKTMGIEEDEYCLIIMREKNDMIYRAAKNAPKIEMNTAYHLNVYDILRADVLIIEQDAFNYIQDFYGDKSDNKPFWTTISDT